MSACNHEPMSSSIWAEVDCDRVASAAMWFGWSMYDTSCNDIHDTLGMIEAEALKL